MARGAPGRRRGTCEGTEKVDRLKAKGGELKNWTNDRCKELDLTSYVLAFSLQPTYLRSAFLVRGGP